MPDPYRSAFSIAAATSGDSGVTLGSKRATTLPFLFTRNLGKFHWISPPVAVRNRYSGAWSSPLTEIFEYMGKVTLYLLLQDVLISSLVPGSWAPKLLAGNPRITNPRSLYFSYSDSIPAYCGVNPHLLATLTISTTLPWYAESGAGLPSIEFRVNSCTLDAPKRDAVITIPVRRSLFIHMGDAEFDTEDSGFPAPGPRPLF